MKDIPQIEDNFSQKKPFVTSAFFAIMSNIILLCLNDVHKGLHLKIFMSASILISAAFIFLVNYDVFKSNQLSKYWSNLLIFVFPFISTILILENQETLLMYAYFLITLFYVMDAGKSEYLDLFILSSILSAFAAEKLLVNNLEWSIQIQCFYLGIIGFVLFGSYHQYKFNKHAQLQFNRLRMLGGAIAHELRTPLGAISLGLEAFQMKLPKLQKIVADQLSHNQGTISAFTKLFDQLTEAAYSMARSARNGSTIIDMLLTKIKNENGNVDYAHLCCAAKIIKDAIEEFPMNSGQKRLIHYTEGYDFEFYSNPDSMKHVIFNLLKNALYQIEKHRNGKIEIWATETPGYNEIHVKDTAIGITPEKIMRIFEESEDGSGIGLPFCKMIVENSGGTIECKSIMHQYTEFVLRFRKNKSKT